MESFANRVFIYQIFYDEATRFQIPSSYIPLDNTFGDSTWYEFMPIVEFLRGTQLQPNTFYGFFSPKFEQKCGLSSSEVIKVASDHSASDVILFSYAWDQLCFFLNPWEQGEQWHPGICSATQSFLSWADVPIRLDRFVCTTKNSVFSNFVVAKANYWQMWLALAEKFLEYCEKASPGVGSLKTHHRDGLLPMKVFIQERFPALVLSDDKLSTTAVVPPGYPIRLPFLRSEDGTRGILMQCDRLKEKMRSEGMTQELLGHFLQLRHSAIRL